MATDDQIEQRIQDLGLTAPRITPADLEANIIAEFYFTAADGAQGRVSETSLARFVGNQFVQSSLEALELLTICVLVLRSGFTVVGTSACASPENFDAKMGRDIARKDAVRQVWPLMGYHLKQHLSHLDLLSKLHPGQGT